MNDQIFKELLDKSSGFIDQLSQKLGVTAELGFQMLVKYQTASGIAAIITIFLWILIQIIAIPFLAKFEEPKSSYALIGKDGKRAIAHGVLAGLSAMLMGFLATAITMILAPEASAINFIISKFN